jgi:hypothetical protein
VALDFVTSAVYGGAVAQDELVANLAGLDEGELLTILERIEVLQGDVAALLVLRELRT